MSRHEQRIGSAGEALAETILRAWGVEQLERVGTPVTVIRTGKKITGAFFGEPVAADYRGVLPILPKFHGTEYCAEKTIGQSVMAEVKTILDRNLTWSDLRPHQPGKLTEHADLGGMSLLVWVHQSGVYILRWPIDGFGPGKGISPEMARELEVRA